MGSDVGLSPACVACEPNEHVHHLETQLSSFLICKVSLIKVPTPSGSSEDSQKVLALCNQVDLPHCIAFSEGEMGPSPKSL